MREFELRRLGRSLKYHSSLSLRRNSNRNFHAEPSRAGPSRTSAARRRVRFFNRRRRHFADRGAFLVYAWIRFSGCAVANRRRTSPCSGRAASGAPLKGDVGITATQYQRNRRDLERWLLLWRHPLRGRRDALSQDKLPLLDLPSHYGRSVRSLVQRATVPSRLVQGAPAQFKSTPKGMRTFCPRCGTHLTFEHGDASDEIDVTTCSLGDPEWLPPDDHTRTSSQLQ